MRAPPPLMSGRARRKSALRSPAVWAGILVLLCALLLYGVTLDDGLRPGELLGGDLITHQYAQVQGRPSNAPGYPLYTMGGWLWFRLGRLLLGPSANPIPILSSYSTLWALVALGLLYTLQMDVTEGNWLLSALCVLFYSVTYFFWYYAVTTEQYASAVAQTLALVLLAFRWEKTQPDTPGADLREAQPSDRYLLAIALLAGIGLAHMVTVLLLAPPLLWFIVTRRPDLLKRPRFIGLVAALAALPLLSYVFVYVRGAQYPEWRGAGEWPSTWSWFWHFVSTGQGRSELTWSLRPLWTAEFPSLIWGELTWVVLALGLLGIGLLGRRRAVLLYATPVFYLLFCWVDRLGNWYQVIMPVYPLLVMGMGVVADRIWSGDRSRPRAPLTKLDVARRAALVAGLLVLIGHRFVLSYPRADSSGRPEDTGLEAGWAILADAPRPDAAILGDHVENSSLSYLGDIWGQRPDVRAVGTAEAQRLLAEGGRALYTTVKAAPLVRSEVSADVHLSSAGVTLIEVLKEPRTDAPELADSLARDLGDNLRLLGHEFFPADWAGLPRPPVLRLYWQAAGPIAHDWAVSVRPTQGGDVVFLDGQLVQFDRLHPVHGLYPTSRWARAEVVRDDHALRLPPGVQADGVMIIVYRAVDDGYENLAQVQLAWSLRSE